MDLILVMHVTCNSSAGGVLGLELPHKQVVPLFCTKQHHHPRIVTRDKNGSYILKIFKKTGSSNCNVLYTNVQIICNKHLIVYKY